MRGMAPFSVAMQIAGGKLFLGQDEYRAPAPSSFLEDDPQ